MSGSTLPIFPGAPQQLAGASWVDGATLYNPDTANSVWVSSTSSVSPGNGAELPPLGTLQWSTKTGIPWACVDTGVTKAVNITVSDDVINPTDPLAIGIQTAIQVNSKGVPNTIIVDQLIGPITIPNNGTIVFDATKYGSIIVTSATLLNGFTLGFDFQAPFISNKQVAGNGQPMIFPAMGKTGTLTNITGTACDFTIYGTNRVWSNVPLSSDFYSTGGCQYSLGSQAYVAGQNVQFPAQPQVGSTFQGPAFAEFGISGTTLKGTFLIAMASGQTVTIADAGEMHATPSDQAVYKMMALPAVDFVMSFTCKVAGTAAVVVNFIPAYI